METFSALLAICAGNLPVTGEFHNTLRPVTRSFDVFLRLNKRSNKQSWGCWFETPSHPLWCHCNAFQGIKPPEHHRTIGCSLPHRYYDFVWNYDASNLSNGYRLITTSFSSNMHMACWLRCIWNCWEGKLRKLPRATTNVQKNKSYVGLFISYVGLFIFYVGLIKSYVGLYNSYVGDKIS